MDTPRPAAERVRHILQAMERSIDSARRQRLHTSGVPTPPPTPTPSNQTTFPRPASTLIQQSNAESGSSTPRLKARPKRTEGFVSPFDQPVYRSKSA